MCAKSLKKQNVENIVVTTVTKVKLNHFALKRFVISVILSTLVDFNMILVAEIKGIKSSKRQKKPKR